MVKIGVFVSGGYTHLKKHVLWSNHAEGRKRGSGVGNLLTHPAALGRIVWCA